MPTNLLDFLCKLTDLAKLTYALCLRKKVSHFYLYNNFGWISDLASGYPDPTGYPLPNRKISIAGMFHSFSH